MSLRGAYASPGAAGTKQSEARYAAAGRLAGGGAQLRRGRRMPQGEPTAAQAVSLSPTERDAEGGRNCGMAVPIMLKISPRSPP